MKVDLEPGDLDWIAEKVAEALKQYLAAVSKEGDTIFDVDGPCAYLHTAPKWVYERSHLKKSLS
jgi:hypothetical protein